MEENQIVPLHLKDLRTIIRSLMNTVSKSLGPNCQQALVTSSTGQMSLTCSGLSILSALHDSHPVAKVIVESITAFHQIYGDGCKTIVVYIDELLSVIELNFSKWNNGSSADTSFRAAVSRSLYEFLNSGLLCVCDDVRQFYSLQNCQEDVKGCQIFWRPLYYVILPCLQGLPEQVGNHLADILTTFVTCTAESGMDFNVIQKCLDNFLFVLPNHSYNNSHISKGLFLQGSVFGQQFSASPAKLIFLQCPLEGNVDKQATDRVMLNCKAAESFLTYRTQVASRTLQVLKNAGVSLILTVHKVPQFVLQMCHSLDLSVAVCLSDVDIDLIMFISGKFPVTSVYDGVREENIVAITSWEHTVIAGKQFVKLTLDESFAKYKPYALFVCVPTESLCQQVKMYVIKSLTVANHCLLGSVNALKKKSVSDTSSMCSSLNTGNVCSSLPPQVEKPGTADGTADWEVKIFQLKHSSVLTNVVAGGGYFEHVLIYFLKQFIKRNTSPQKQMCCHFIIKMLEALPKMLHNNQLVSKSGHSCSFLYSQHDIMKAIDVAVTCGVTSKNMFAYFQSCSLDVLNIKFEMVFAAINLVVKLLRIHCIVGVNRLIQQRHTSDTEPDDDDDR
ncbi:hypothetical protein BsWGS_16521 [Bradybaena similaris]